MALTNPFRRKPTPVAAPAASPPLPAIEPLSNKAVSPAARQLLSEWLDQPMTKMALRLIEGEKPHTTTRLTADPALNAASEVRRLHQLQGWDLYHKTLLTLRNSPAEVAKTVIETYPTQD